jgi:hypothetical protein
MKMTADPTIESIPEMFLITVSQGQKNVSIPGLSLGETRW